MKRVLVPTLIAVACGAAMAQAAPTVTLYGILDVGVQRVTGYAKGTDWAMVSGIMDGSRFGFRGNEDLGGGYRAIFTMENRTEANNGTLSNRPPSGSQVPDRFSQAALLGLPAALQPAVSGVAASIGSGVGVNFPNAQDSTSRFFDRQLYVGLVTPVGGILAGRQYTPAYEVNAFFDVTQTQSSLSAGQVASLPATVDIRVSNALKYVIQQGPFTADLMYAFGGISGNNKAYRLMGGMAMYRTDAFSAGLGYNQRNNELGQKSLQSTIIGAAGKIGPGTLTGFLGLVKDDNPTGVSTIAATLTPAVGAAGAALVQGAFTNALKQDGRLFNIGYRLPIGGDTLYVAVSRYDDRTALNADTDSYGAVYTYALSKRTDVNAVLTRFNNKGLGQAAPGQAGFLGGVTSSAGTDSTSMALGLRHRF